MDEYDLKDGYDTSTLYLMRVLGHRARMLSVFRALIYHAESNDRHGYLWTLTNTLKLIFHMANEAGLETVLSAAYSLKHASDMEKSFPTQDEAFDKAKQMGLSPEQAARLFLQTYASLQTTGPTHADGSLISTHTVTEVPINKALPHFGDVVVMHHAFKKPPSFENRGTTGVCLGHDSNTFSQGPHLG